jgi:hypothetical protein
MMFEMSAPREDIVAWCAENLVGKYWAHESTGSGGGDTEFFKLGRTYQLDRDAGETTAGT